MAAVRGDSDPMWLVHFVAPHIEVKRRDDGTRLRIQPHHLVGKTGSDVEAGRVWRRFCRQAGVLATAGAGSVYEGQEAQCQDDAPGFPAPAGSGLVLLYQRE